MAEFIDIEENNKHKYNNVINHPLQSYEWGEFRKKTGVKVIRRGLIENGKIIDGFTLTLHKIPKTKFFIGYLPKGNKPSNEIFNELLRIGEVNNCVFIQLEPNLKVDTKYKILNTKYELKPAAHPLFTKYTFILDISKSEEELLSQMHHKTRYNIRVAQKHGVKVIEDNSSESFKKYFELMEETTKRQKFYAHTPSYHKTLWETLQKDKKENELSYHLLNAVYKEGNKTKALTSWVLFSFHDYLYYPYGASSRENRETMSSNLMMWEAILFGKKMGLKYFDMWGALGPEPDTRDPWYGFHRFKQGYGAEHMEFIGSYDLVINPLIYQIYKVVDKARWTLLTLKSKLG